MRLFQWTATHDVFLPAIDNEHRTIFQIVSELQLSLRARAPQFQVEEILHRLIAHIEDHFSHEEKLMTETHYLSLKWHKEQHNTLRKRIRALSALVQAGDMESGRELVEFITHWFDDHTSLTDRMLGAHLRNQQRARLR
jgi:hemerythrin